MNKLAILVIFGMTNFVHDDIQFIFRNDAYSTHQPILYEIAKNTTGPIIEFGCGNGSTDLLHEICKKENRLLITLDDDAEWFNRFKAKYTGDGYTQDNSGWHKFYFVPGKISPSDQDPSHWVKFIEESDLLQNLTFDVCFIDQSPWLARFETLKRFKNKSKYVLVHDCDYFPGVGVFGKVVRPSVYGQDIGGIFDYSDVFKYFKVYFPPSPWPGFSGPPTLVGSEFENDFPEMDYLKY